MTNLLLVQAEKLAGFARPEKKIIFKKNRKNILHLYFYHVLGSIALKKPWMYFFNQSSFVPYLSK